MSNAKEAREIAGQIWADKVNEHKVMDTDLAFSFAERYEKLLDQIENLKAKLQEKPKAHTQPVRSIDADWAPSQR